jgi:YggT family protein
MQEILFAFYRYFLDPLLGLFLFVLFVYVVYSWLIVFQVVSLRNPTARSIHSFLVSVIEPLARPLRRILPQLGQLDLSIFMLFLITVFLKDWALPYLIRLVPA